MYSEKFVPVQFFDNPKSSLTKLKSDYCSEIKNCDAIIVIHPNWWGQPPAIIKGWMDSILLPGVAYNLESDLQGNFKPVGALKATKALIFTTSNTQNNFEHDILDTIWKDNVFKICGVNDVERINFGKMSTSTLEERKLWLEEVKQTLDKSF